MGNIKNTEAGANQELAATVKALEEKRAADIGVVVSGYYTTSDPLGKRKSPAPPPTKNKTKGPGPIGNKRSFEIGDNGRLVIPGRPSGGDAEIPVVDDIFLEEEIPKSLEKEIPKAAPGAGAGVKGNRKDFVVKSGKIHLKEPLEKPSAREDKEVLLEDPNRKKVVIGNRPREEFDGEGNWIKPNKLEVSNAEKPAQVRGDYGNKFDAAGDEITPKKKPAYTPPAMPDVITKFQPMGVVVTSLRDNEDLLAKAGAARKAGQTKEKPKKPGLLGRVISRLIPGRT